MFAGYLWFKMRLIVQFDQSGGTIQIQVGIHEFSANRVQAERSRARLVKRELTP